MNVKSPVFWRTWDSGYKELESNSLISTDKSLIIRYAQN
jgi:hypothetical protein